MADVRISQLSEALPNKNSAIIPFSDGSTTYRTAPSGIVAASPGCILQSILKTSTNTVDNQTTTYADITNLLQTITPKSVNSKILIAANIAILYASNNYIYVGLQIVRDSTIIYTDDYATGMGVNIQLAPYVTVPLFVQDTPNTTNPVTYKVQFKRTSFAGTYGGACGVGYNSRPSTLLIQEIAG